MRKVPQDQISHSEPAVRNDQPPLPPLYATLCNNTTTLVFLSQKYPGTRNRSPALGAHYACVHRLRHEEVDYQNVLCNDPRREGFFFVSKWRRQWKSIMARDQKTLQGKTKRFPFSLQISRLAFRVTIDRLVRPVPPFPSPPFLLRFSFFFPGFIGLATENISTRQSPCETAVTCRILSSSHWARIGHLLSFRARSSQIVANDSELPTDRLRKRMERRALNRLFAIVSFAKSRSPRE